MRQQRIQGYLKQQQQVGCNFGGCCQQSVDGVDVQLQKKNT